MCLDQCPLWASLLYASIRIGQETIRHDERQGRRNSSGSCTSGVTSEEKHENDGLEEKRKRATIRELMRYSQHGNE